MVSLHYVLSERSRSIVGAQELAATKKSALAMDTSRGALTNQAAPGEAANKGDIRGVALDVFDSLTRSLWLPTAAGVRTNGG